MWPPVEQVHTAIKWLENKALDYHLDPNRIALFGESEIKNSCCSL
jgi:acetyl esterase/lipase